LKRKVVEISDLEKLSPVFRGKKGKWLADLFLRVFALDKVNSLYDRSCDHKGADFAASLLKDLGVNCYVGNAERLKSLPEGAFITVSNHPYGGIDGIMLIDLLVGIRPDYKLMVNQVLSLVEAMDENFISVKPRIGKNSTDATVGINGIRETLTRMQEGHPVGFFPAGAVSMFRFKYFCVRDRDWQDSMIKLIQLAKVPVVPIRFFDQNSSFFYFLGMINWKIRLVRMSYELFNKRKHKSRIGIGNIISVEEQSKCSNPKELGSLLRNALYHMPKPGQFTSMADIKFQRK
jgi:putative hemolysin